MQVITVRKSLFEDKQKFKELIEELAGLDSNLMVFGLPNSGKSTLVKAVCGKNSKFCTLPEEEVMDEEGTAEIRTEPEDKKWAVSHQYPAMHGNATDKELKDFLEQKMGLNPKKWQIIRINTE